MSCYNYVNLNDCSYRLLDPTLESKINFEMESAIFINWNTYCKYAEGAPQAFGLHILLS